MLKLRAIWFLTVLIYAAPSVLAQNYTVISVNNGGVISGTVKWSGPQPAALNIAVNKDSEVCDPESHKTVNLERLVLGPDGGVANTVVFLKDVTRGKAMNMPEARRFLDQKHCRYEPHILLVPKNGELSMKSSDAVLHTVHMDGAATFNIPFPFQDRVISRNMDAPGLVNLKCNGGHAWMNAEMIVAPHPYYAVTDLNGEFQLTDVPPGDYELVAWHEGWHVLKREEALDVFSQKAVPRIIFTDDRTWEKAVTVRPDDTSVVNFTISDK